MKRFLKNGDARINLIMVMITTVSFLVLFAIEYFMMYNAMIDDIKERAISVNEYVQGIIEPDSLICLNDVEDENDELYIKVHEQMVEIRKIANIQYLYTSKINDKGQLTYVIDGLDLNAPDFRHIGEPIEEELRDDLARCMRGEIINSEGIYNTEWGNVYVTYWPVRDGAGNVVGAVGMEFNVDNIVSSFERARTFGILLSMVILAVIILISRFTLKRVSEPFYKKLAYQDFLTGLPNRMAFEQHIRECEMNKEKRDKVTLIIFDLNDLKRVNDNYGHRAGDTYIQKSAEIIAHALSHLGETYRIGGDELSTIIVGRSGYEIREALNEMFDGVKMIMKDCRFDCSYGVAAFDPKTDNNLHNVFDRADMLMYEQKRMSKENKKHYKTGG